MGSYATEWMHNDLQINDQLSTVIAIITIFYSKKLNREFYCFSVTFLRVEFGDVPEQACYHDAWQKSKQ